MENAATAPTTPVHIGRYELLGVIGTGGMGRIYLARVSGEGGFEREVALKVMHDHLLVEDEFVAMFLDEARLAARIRHPNVVSTLDVQKTQSALFLVMDLVEGLSLADLFKRRRIRASQGESPPSSDSDAGSSRGGRSSGVNGRGSRPKRYEPFPVDVACRIATDMLRGLHAAHELTDREGTPLNLVHRDVSPGNVLIGKDGIARITDFGVARAETRLTATVAGQIKGKIPYMPPEQLVADTIDRRADVYAAGVVLWEMLSGRRLFRNKNQGLLIQEILKGAQVRPGQLRADIPRALDHVCMRALTIDLERRFATAAEFAAEIKNALRMTGRAGAASDEVAAFVEGYGTNLEHMDEARRSAPSISGVDLMSQTSGAAYELTPISAPHTPQLISGASNAAPPPLPVTEVTMRAAGGGVAPPPDSVASSITMSSGTLAGAEAARASGRGARTLLAVFGAAIVGGGIAIAAYRSGSAEVSEPQTDAAVESASEARGAEGAQQAVAAETPKTAPAPRETAAPASEEEPSAPSATAEAAPETATPRRRVRTRSPKRRAPAAKPKEQEKSTPVLSEQLPTEL